MSGIHAYYILACDNWGDYVGFRREGDPYLEKLEYGGETTLAYIINEWLWYNGGVRRCFNRFDIFLKIVPFMINDYYRRGAQPFAIYRGSSSEVVKKYRIVSVLEDDDRQDRDMPTIFDSDNFQAALVTDEAGVYRHTS